MLIKMLKTNRYLLVSIGIHIVLGWLFSYRVPKIAQPPTVIEIVSSSPQIQAGKGKQEGKQARLQGGKLNSKKNILTRLGVSYFSKLGKLGGLGSGGERDGTQFAHDLLTTESKVWDVFDRLAGRIHQHLDYPEMLAENGVQGNATLDVYFNSDGELDEDRSKTYGDNRYVRGLLIRATRKGLVEWQTNEANRIRKDQFRNQHFRADFVIAYSQTDQSEVIKTQPGSYQFLRKRVSNVTCLGAVGGAPILDFACVAMQVGGAIHRSVSDRYKSRLAALKEMLDYYDGLDLKGIHSRS